MKKLDFMRMLRVVLLLAFSLMSASPSNSLFVQPDQLELSLPGVGVNRYSYSLGDPINNQDPGGLCVAACVGDAVAIASGPPGWAILAGVVIVGGAIVAIESWRDRDEPPPIGHNQGPPLEPDPQNDPDPVDATVALLGAAGIEISRDRVAELGNDPIKGFDAPEAQHAARYENRFGVTLTRSERVGTDYVISGTGETIDAVGPFPSNHFSIRAVSRSIDRHLRKSTDRVSIDATGLSDEQKSALRDDITARSEEAQGRIDTIGLDY